MNINKTSDDFDIYDLFSKIIKRKLIIFVIVILSFIVSASLSLLIPNKYLSSATLYVNEPINQQSSSDFGGIAAIVGIAGSGGYSKIDLAREMLYSRVFLNNLIKKDDVLLNIFASKSFDSSSKKIIYNPKLYDDKSKKWVALNNNGIKAEPTMLQVQKKYNEIIEFSEDKKSGFVKISVLHHSPIFAHDFLQLIINELNSLSRLDALEDAQESLTFLEAKLATTQQLDLRESLLELIGAQLEKQMVATVQLQYILKVLDNPVIPEKKMSPNRTMIVILGTIFGFVLSIIYVLILENYLRRINLYRN